jgi:hypothetical protein
MDMAVGRLQFSVRFADTRSTPVEEPARTEEDAVEAAFRRERTFRDVAADRERWAGNTSTHGGYIL